MGVEEPSCFSSMDESSFELEPAPMPGGETGTLYHLRLVEHGKV